MENVIIKDVISSNEDFIILCDELDDFLNETAGGEIERDKYKKFNYCDTMDYVIVTYAGEKPVGCAALRKYSDEEIEVKRVFVREEYRGKKIGGIMMENLIVQSKRLGYKRMILETGELLKASVRLYSKYGFEIIPNYGAYVNMPESLCMGRSLKDSAVTIQIRQL